MIEEITEYEDFDAWYDALSGSDPCPGVDIRLNLTDGPTPEDLRKAADDLDLSCCGANWGLGIVAGKVYWRYVDFGH